MEGGRKLVKVVKKVKSFGDRVIIVLKNHSKEDSQIISAEIKLDKKDWEESLILLTKGVCQE